MFGRFGHLNRVNGVDILIIFIVIIGAAIGVIMGLFRSIVNLVSFALATILASHFYLPLGRIIERVTHSAQLSKEIPFAIIFGLSFIILAILGLLAYRLVTTLNLGIADRLGGALLGIIGAIFFISICVILLTKYPFAHSRELFRESTLIPYCFQTTKFIINILPREFTNTIYEFYREEPYTGI